MKTQRILLAVLCLVATLAFLGSPAMAAPAENEGPVASASVTSSEITWLPKVNYASIVLTVSIPGGEVLRREFPVGAKISFNIIDSQGQRHTDGSYTYELRVTPNVSPGIKSALSAARENGNGEAVSRELSAKGFIPKEPLVQSGAFSIINGAIVMGGGSEGGGKGGGDFVGMKRLRNKPQARTVAGHRLMPASVGTANYRYTNAYNASAAMMFIQVFNMDVIVQGSECVGIDCTSSESFGFDTIRLKENNLRIKFEDTSTGTFPSNDWQLTANDSANGGANKFSIDDIDNARTPFTIEGNARTNSLYVDDNGRIGNNTATPAVEIHSVDGDSPTLRLEQNGSSGFQAQTWDVAGNETNFFIRDVTNGSLLPFKIIPGAPTNSMYIQSNGAVGLGTTTPAARLDVAGNVIVQGTIDIFSNPFPLAPSRQLNAKSVLDRLALVSVSTSEDGGVTHYNPSFQDLEAVFGAGSSGRVSLLDIDGINMAAIKAVGEILAEKDAQIADLQQKNAALEAQLADIDRRLKALEGGSKK